MRLAAENVQEGCRVELRGARGGWEERSHSVRGCCSHNRCGCVGRRGRCSPPTTADVVRTTHIPAIVRSWRSGKPSGKRRVMPSWRRSGWRSWRSDCCRCASARLYCRHFGSRLFACKSPLRRELWRCLGATRPAARMSSTREGGSTRSKAGLRSHWLRADYLGTAGWLRA